MSFDRYASDTAARAEGGGVSPVVIGNATLHLGDCLEVMATMPANSIDLTVTSPPYDNLRTYNGTMDEIVKRLAFWIIYTKAVEHYKYMKEE